MTVKLAIFDFDGTLANTYPLFVSALRELAIKHRFRHPDADEQHRLRGMGAAQVLRELRLPLWRVPAVSADYRRIMHERIAEIALFPGIAQALRTLAEHRIELALATSNTRENVESVLGSTLLERFSALECGTSLFGKPQRLRRILKDTHCAPDATIYIGDELRDADAARRVGMRFGAVAWGYTSLDALLDTQPDRVFDAPADLPSLIRTAHTF
jgi:phosphoglycolate phosphatase